MFVFVMDDASSAASADPDFAAGVPLLAAGCPHSVQPRGYQRCHQCILTKICFIIRQPRTWPNNAGRAMLSFLSDHKSDSS